MIELGRKHFYVPKGKRGHTFVSLYLSRKLVPLLFCMVDQAFNNAWVERPEYLSSMYVTSREGKRLVGRFIYQIYTQ